jgi:uncharacterized RDD family membrane protein YckC
MENNVINLVSHIQKRKEIKTFNEFEHQNIDHSKERLTQRRIYSFLVDFSSICVLSAAINTSYAIFINEFLFNLKMSAKTGLITNTFWLQASIFILTYTTYFLYSLFILDGQTFGKKIFKLTTVSDDYFHNETDDSNDITLKQSFQRTAGYLACYLSFGTFFIFSMMSEDKRGLPDYLSSSRTVSLEWLKSTIAQRSAKGDIIQIDIHSLSESEKIAA